MNNNPSYGVLDDEEPVYDNVYELRDQQIQNIGNNSSVRKITKNQRCLKIVTIVMTIFAAVALLVAIAALALATLVFIKLAPQEASTSGAPAHTHTDSRNDYKQATRTSGIPPADFTVTQENRLTANTNPPADFTVTQENRLTANTNPPADFITTHATSVASVSVNPPSIEGSIGTLENPAKSCKDIPQGSPSKEYYIQPSNNSSPFTVYCDMHPRYNSSSPGGWTRVANLNMTNWFEECPSGFDRIAYEHGTKHYCHREATTTGCASTVYSTHGIEYSQVCGRVSAYQIDYGEAFRGFSYGYQLSLDAAYVDGVSVTHGTPRQHIWTFACAASEGVSDDSVCPCTKTDSEYTGFVPPFIGQDYFCDTAVSKGKSDFDQSYYFLDPLWDGQGCGSTSSCCEFNNPPWFCKQLPEPTTDDIEVRICEYNAVDLYHIEGPVISSIQISIQ